MIISAMKTITIAMQKGGVGKSTLTRSLAVAASKVGHNVLVLDMDAQQSISQWAERRDEQLPVVKFSSGIELPKMLERAKRAGCDLVIIDTTPARSTAAPAAVEEADLVIVPCTPDIEAYEQLPRTARLSPARPASQPSRPDYGPSQQPKSSKSSFYRVRPSLDGLHPGLPGDPVAIVCSPVQTASSQLSRV